MGVSPDATLSLNYKDPEAAQLLPSWPEHWSRRATQHERLDTRSRSPRRPPPGQSDAASARARVVASGGGGSPLRPPPRSSRLPASPTAPVKRWARRGLVWKLTIAAMWRVRAGGATHASTCVRGGAAQRPILDVLELYHAGFFGMRNGILCEKPNPVFQTCQGAAGATVQQSAAGLSTRTTHAQM